MLIVDWLDGSWEVFKNKIRNVIACTANEVLLKHNFGSNIFEFNSNSLTLNRINARCYFYMFRSKGKNNRNEERNNSSSPYFRSSSHWSVAWVYHENKNRCVEWRSLYAIRRSSFHLSSSNIRFYIYSLHNTSTPQHRKYFLPYTQCRCRPDSVETTQNPTVERKRIVKQKRKKYKNVPM